MGVICKPVFFYIDILSVEKSFSQIIKDPFDKPNAVTDLHIKLKLCEYATTLLCQKLENLSKLLGEWFFQF